MSRQEFLQRLREALSGEVSGSVIEENIRYYEEYIGTEVRNGSTEEAVIASGRRMHYIDLSKWYWKLLGVTVLILFFFLIASIVTGIFSLLMPIMGPLLLVFLIVWFVRGRKR